MPPREALNLQLRGKYTLYREEKVQLVTFNSSQSNIRKRSESHANAMQILTSSILNTSVTPAGVTSLLLRNRRAEKSRHDSMPQHSNDVRATDTPPAVATPPHPPECALFELTVYLPFYLLQPCTCSTISYVDINDGRP